MLSFNIKVLSHEIRSNINNTENNQLLEASIINTIHFIYIKVFKTLHKEQKFPKEEVKKDYTETTIF